MRGRSLNVFLLAPWNARAKYAGIDKRWEASRFGQNELTPEETDVVAKMAKLTKGVPERFYLTQFFDRNEVRPGYDLVFEEVVDTHRGIGRGILQLEPLWLLYLKESAKRLHSLNDTGIELP
jgi:hypothetical protein